jgi:aminopeptidase-like protein
MLSNESKMYDWMCDLFPLNRSITGSGTRETLEYLSKLIPGMSIYSVKSGTKAFDWRIPNEWSISQAYIEDSYGNRIVDFKNNNLHIVGYSIPVDDWFELGELEKHLHSLPDQPDAIPYVTSYYSRTWGFCIKHREREKLKPGSYHVVIKSEIFSGEMNYGELIIPGLESKEILLSTYVCHPSMANNELSGPIVTTALAQWLLQQKNLRYTYRILFIPETIGSIYYLSKHYQELCKNVIAGYVITCVGDDRCFSYIASRDGNTLSDRVAQHVLKFVSPDYKIYSFLDRGSDERQYCSPGIDLPIASITRSKYHEYPEYHTSLDDLNFVTRSGLEGSLDVYKKVINCIENNYLVKSLILCEPQLGKRGLYPKFTTKDNMDDTTNMKNLIAYADGRSALEISELIRVPFWKLQRLLSKLIKENILSIKSEDYNN